MGEIKRHPSIIRFGVFEIDLQSAELRRQGVKVKLQEQPYLVLVMLLERPGEAVTREELQKKLWPVETFVDFERGLNRAINKIREALVDNAESPRFIETLPRRGYRFVAPVETTGPRAIAWPGPSDLASSLPAERPHKLEEMVPAVVSGKRQRLPWIVACLMALAAGIGVWRPWQAPARLADRPFLQLDLDAGPDEFSQPAISRDGTRIVFVSNGFLALRRLDQANVTRMAGTEGAFHPFFSPNGQWVAFYSGRKLLKVAVDGGIPITLCDAPGYSGGTWTDDDHIVTGLNPGLVRVAAAGGTPQPLTDPKSDPGGLMHRWPQALPGDKGILFAATNGSWQGISEGPYSERQGQDSG